MNLRVLEVLVGYNSRKEKNGRNFYLEMNCVFDFHCKQYLYLRNVFVTYLKKDICVKFFKNYLVY